MEPDAYMALAGHTFGARIDGRDACPGCPGEHGTPGRCDHGHYSRRYLRFVKAHALEFEAAYVNPDPSTSNAVRERLEREWATLPPRHDCSCVCPNQRGPRPQGPCRECVQLQYARRFQTEDVGLEIGRHGAPAHAPMPSVTMLDVHAGYAA